MGVGGGIGDESGVGTTRPPPSTPWRQSPARAASRLGLDVLDLGEDLPRPPSLMLLLDPSFGDWGSGRRNPSCSGGGRRAGSGSEVRVQREGRRAPPVTERKEGAAGDSAREGGCGTRERPIWIGDRERKAAGGRKGGEVRER